KVSLNIFAAPLLNIIHNTGQASGFSFVNFYIIKKYLRRSCVWHSGLLNLISVWPMADGYDGQPAARITILEQDGRMGIGSIRMWRGGRWTSSEPLAAVK